MKDIKDFFTDDEIKAMSLGDRMKWWEKSGDKVLDNDQPAIIRIDGKAFHTYTKGFDKPFDQYITGAMKYAMVKLCEDIQNVKIGYMQSDEISLLMTTHENTEKQAWFGGKVDKIVSVAASMASAHFNHYMNSMYWNPRILSAEIIGEAPKRKIAIFDARVWNVPMYEVNNVFVWREQDAIRNSVSALAQSHFSHSKLHGKNVSDMKEMLMEIGVDWSKLPVTQQRGFCANRVYFDKDGAQRSKWEIGHETPIFAESKDYVSKFVEVLDI